MSQLSLQPQSSCRIRSRPRHRRRHARAARLAAAGRALGVRARSRRHHSGGIRAAAALSRRAGRCRARSQDRGLSAPHPGRPRRLAAVPRRRLRHERERQGLFRAQDDRRFHRCAAHGTCARSHPLARRRVPLQRVHAADAGAVRLHSLARRAGHAGRDHAAAEVVSVPSRQDFVLEPHRHRAAARAAGARSRRRAIPRACASTSSSSSRRDTIGPTPKAPQQKAAWFWFFRGVDVGAARRRAVVSDGGCGSARSTARWHG